MSTSVVLRESGCVLLAGLALVGSLFAADGSGWEKRTFSEGEPVNAVASFDSILVIGTENGIKHSADGGVTWTAAERGLVSGRVTAVAHVGGRLVAADRDKFFSSDDGGVSWVPASGSEPYMTVVGFTTSGDSVFAMLSLFPGIDPNPEFMYLSLDRGLSWSDAGASTGTMPYDPLSIGGDTVIAIRKGIIERGVEGGARWSPMPVDSGWGRFSSLAILGGRIYATTGSLLLQSPGFGADFSVVQTDPRASMPYHLAAYGKNVCASSRTRISCSEDEGSNWTQASLNFHPFDFQLMAMGAHYLYTGDIKNWLHEGLRRFDISAKTWSHPAWLEEVRQNEPSYAFDVRFAAYGEKVAYSSKRFETGPIMFSENQGESWNSLPFRYHNSKSAIFMSKGWRGVIGHTQGLGLDSIILFAKDGENTWHGIPGNFPEGISRKLSFLLPTEIAASGSRFFLCGNPGELWKGDMERKTWSKINTPGEMRVCQNGQTDRLTFLAASDSALYASTPTGLWRLPLSEGTVAVTPTKGSLRPRSPKALISSPSAGSGKFLVTPAPSGRSRPGTYDFNGIRQPEIGSGEGPQ